MEDGRKVHVVLIGWACTTLCLVSYAAAFSHGASPSACTDMMPQHMRVQLHSPRNNYVTVHTNMSFFPGDKVPVTVRSSRDFMGFLLQARKVSNDEIAGTFVFIPPGSKLLTCFEDGDTVTHSDKSLKRNLSFVWKAPDQPIGDIKFFISVVQSYFVYWAKIESATVAQQVQNKTSADRRKAAEPLTPAPLQEFTDPQVAGMANKGAAVAAAVPSSPQPARALPSGLAALPAAQAPRPGLGTQTEAQPVADPQLLSRALLDAAVSAVSSSSGGSSNFSVQGLEPSLAFQQLGLTSTWPSFLLQDYSTSYSPDDGYCTSTKQTQSISSATRTQVCATCTEGGQMTAANWAVLKTSPYTTVSHSAPYIYTGLLETAVATAQIGSWDSASNLSSASRQTALQPEEAGPSGHEEEAAGGEVVGNTPASVTRAAPQSAAPGTGQDSGRGTRLLAAQLGILLVCTAVLGLALAAGLRCVCAQHCHKRTEVTLSEPDTAVITVRESGEMLHFRRIRENSFVLVQAEYNWVSPSGSGKNSVI